VREKKTKETAGHSARLKFEFDKTERQKVRHAYGCPKIERVGGYVMPTEACVSLVSGCTRSEDPVERETVREKTLGDKMKRLSNWMRKEV
jgi:hypothetical protein